MWGEQQKGGGSVWCELVMQLLVPYHGEELVYMSKLVWWTVAGHMCGPLTRTIGPGCSVSFCRSLLDSCQVLLSWLCELLPCWVTNHLGILDLYCKMATKARSISLFGGGCFFFFLYWRYSNVTCYCQCVPQKENISTIYDCGPG